MPATASSCRWPSSSSSWERLDEAQAIGGVYAAQLRPKSRAYAGLVDGLIALRNENYVDAIDTLRAAIEYRDLWILRFYLGQAYLIAAYPPAANAEFDGALERRSEAMAMFFDDVPTWRYTARLDEWRQRARQTLTNRSGQ
jgi:hypothetical protein